MASVVDAGRDARVVKVLRLSCLWFASLGLGLLAHHAFYLWGI